MTDFWPNKVFGAKNIWRNFVGVFPQVDVNFLTDVLPVRKFPTIRQFTSYVSSSG
jgi:hypothetical protein